MRHEPQQRVWGRHDLHLGPSKEPLARRIYRELAGHLAARLGYCLIHRGSRLICAWCDLTWTGTAAEEREVEALSAETDVHDLAWPTWPCGRCGAQDSAVCLDCCVPTEKQSYGGLIPEERARFQELLGHLVTTSRPESADGRHGDGREPREGEETS
jgi:hypothetical protein